MPASVHRLIASLCAQRYAYGIALQLRACTWLAFALLCGLPAAASAEVVVSAVRVWPAAEYTRITLESAQPLEYTVFTAKNPERLVVDLDGVGLGQTLRTLPEYIGANDPYISRARLAFNRPGVVRLVLELKTEVKPQAFALKPVGEYGHRLVIDVYPAHPSDPLQALVEQLEKDKPRGSSPPAATDDPLSVNAQHAEEAPRPEAARIEPLQAIREHEAKSKRAQEADPPKQPPKVPGPSSRPSASCWPRPGSGSMCSP